MSYQIAPMESGRYAVALARTSEDVAQAQAFRAARFGLSAAHDQDALDDSCAHVLVRDRCSGALVCCYRMLSLTGQGLQDSYAAHYYDVSALRSFDGPFLEMGRFCVDDTRRDPDILRLAWAAMTAYVDACNVTLLFGCSSFRGTDPEPYRDAFAFLKQQALAPARWTPGRKAGETYAFAAEIDAPADKRRALQQMPPLLRTYLGMGGWVSDHAVVDRAMNTLHVFTAVETASIPASRQRLLRALHKNTSAA